VSDGYYRVGIPGVIRVQSRDVQAYAQHTGQDASSVRYRAATGQDPPHAAAEQRALSLYEQKKGEGFTEAAARNIAYTAYSEMTSGVAPPPGTKFYDFMAQRVVEAPQVRQITDPSQVEPWMLQPTQEGSLRQTVDAFKGWVDPIHSGRVSAEVERRARLIPQKMGVGEQEIKTWHGNVIFQSAMEKAFGKETEGKTYIEGSPEHKAITAKYEDLMKSRVTLEAQGKILSARRAIEIDAMKQTMAKETPLTSLAQESKMELERVQHAIQRGDAGDVFAVGHEDALRGAAAGLTGSILGGRPEMVVPITLGQAAAGYVIHLPEMFGKGMGKLVGTAKEMVTPWKPVYTLSPKDTKVIGPGVDVLGIPVMEPVKVDVYAPGKFTTTPPGFLSDLKLVTPVEQAKLFEKQVETISTGVARASVIFAPEIVGSGIKIGKGVIAGTKAKVAAVKAMTKPHVTEMPKVFEGVPTKAGWKAPTFESGKMVSVDASGKVVELGVKPPQTTLTHTVSHEIYVPGAKPPVKVVPKVDMGLPSIIEGVPSKGVELYPRSELGQIIKFSKGGKITTKTVISEMSKPPLWKTGTQLQERISSAQAKRLMDIKYTLSSKREVFGTIGQKGELYTLTKGSSSSVNLPPGLKLRPTDLTFHTHPSGEYLPSGMDLYQIQTSVPKHAILSSKGVNIVQYDKGILRTQPYHWGEVAKTAKLVPDSVYDPGTFITFTKEGGKLVAYYDPVKMPASMYAPTKSSFITFDSKGRITLSPASAGKPLTYTLSHEVHPHQILRLTDQLPKPYPVARPMQIAKPMVMESVTILDKGGVTASKLVHSEFIHAQAVGKPTTFPSLMDTKNLVGGIRTPSGFVTFTKEGAPIVEPLKIGKTLSFRPVDSGLVTFTKEGGVSVGKVPVPKGVSTPTSSGELILSKKMFGQDMFIPTEYAASGIKVGYSPSGIIIVKKKGAYLVPFLDDKGTVSGVTERITHLPPGTKEWASTVPDYKYIWDSARITSGDKGWLGIQQPKVGSPQLKAWVWEGDRGWMHVQKPHSGVDSEMMRGFLPGFTWKSYTEGAQARVPRGALDPRVEWGTLAPPISEPILRSDRESMTDTQQMQITMPRTQEWTRIQRPMVVPKQTEKVLLKEWTQIQEPIVQPIPEPDRTPIYQPLPTPPEPPIRDVPWDKPEIKIPIQPEFKWLQSESKPRSYSKAFAVQVKVRGEWKEAAVLPKFKAISLGKKITGATPARSFRLIPRGVTREADIPRQPDLSKYYRKDGKFIEKTKYAIDEPGEFRGITMKGLAAQRKNYLKRLI
jgi:hypothetical protein